MAPPKPPPPQACCATHDVIGRVWRTLMRPFRRRGGRRLNWRQLVPGGVGVGSVAGDDYDEDEDDPSEDDDSALLGGSGNSSAEDDSDAAASLLLGDLESNPKESMQHEAHERERKRMLLPVYEKKHELFFAPLSLVTTNGGTTLYFVSRGCSTVSWAGLVYSAYWCIARELYFEAFAYLFLFLASVAMHGYRDSRSWQWPKQTRNRLVELLMRLDYMAVFHLSCAVSIYLVRFLTRSADPDFFFSSSYLSLSFTYLFRPSTRRISSLSAGRSCTWHRCCCRRFSRLDQRTKR